MSYRAGSPGATGSGVRSRAWGRDRRWTAHEGGDERIDVDCDITAAFCEERPHEDLLDEVVEEARGKVVADQSGTYDLAPRTSQEG